MGPEEIVIIVICLLIGYWGVSRLLSSKNGPVQFDPTASTPPRNNKPPFRSDKVEQWFDVLKVDRNAGADEIHTAYKKLMSQYHPDKVSSLGEDLRTLAEAKSKAINAAYQDALRARGQWPG